MFEKYYRVLDLKPGSSKEAVKRAFRRKALELHPDRNPGLDTSKDFLKVVEAYDVLFNGVLPRKRHEDLSKERKKEEKEERLRKARAKAREAIRERREIERTFYRRINKSYLMKFAQFQAFLFSLFAILIVFNYYMPYTTVESNIESKNMLYFYHLKEERAFIYVCGKSYQTSLSDFFYLDKGDPVKLEKTFLFKDVMKVSFKNREGQVSTVEPHESLYMLFPLIPLLMLIPFLNLLFREPTVRFYVLFFFSVFIGTALFLYILFDGGRFMRMFQDFSC